MDRDRSRQVVDVPPPAVGILKDRKKECWSFSSLSQIINCALQFRYQRIDRLPPEFTSDNLIYGSSIHAAASWMWRLRKEGQRVQRAEIVDVFAGTMTRMAAEAGKIQYDEDASLDSLIREGRELVGVLIEGQRDDETIIEVDLTFAVPLQNSRGKALAKPLVGEMDLLVSKGTGDKLTIRDLKTAKRRYDAGKIQHDLQPTTYLYALNQLHPQEAADFEWLVIIKNKKPELVPYETTRSQGDFDRLFALARTADRLIEAGAFLPNRSGFWCKSCPFQGACSNAK